MLWLTYYRRIGAGIMKNQLKNHSIIKVILLSIYLTVFLESCMLSAQNTKAQKIEQTEQSHVELTQALFTAVTNRLIDEAENLIAQGAEANGVDAYGSTPLHIAVAAGHVDIVKLLITHGARLDIKDNTGRTPLHYAAGANIQAHPRVEVPQKRLLVPFLLNKFHFC